MPQLGLKVLPEHRAANSVLTDTPRTQVGRCRPNTKAAGAPSAAAEVPGAALRAGGGHRVEWPAVLGVDVVRSLLRVGQWLGRFRGHIPISLLRLMG